MPTYDPATARRELSVLLMAPPGGSKTTFMLQWPGVGVLNLDDNLAGPVRYLKKAGLFRPFKYHNCFEDSKGQRIAVADQIGRVSQAVDDFIADPEVKIIALDSMTSYELGLTSKVLVMQGKANPMNPREPREDATMEMQYWQPWRAILSNLVMKIRNSGKMFFLLTHCDFKYRSMMEKVNPGGLEKITPTLPSRMRDWIGYVFTDVWFLELVDAGGGLYKSRITTMPDATKDLKNSLNLKRQFFVGPKEIQDIITATQTI